MLEASDAQVPWQRVLWLKQPAYPDNYHGEHFLEDLKRNGECGFSIDGLMLMRPCSMQPVNVRKYTYTGLILDTLPVTLHLTSNVTFASVFTYVYDGKLLNLPCTSKRTDLQVDCLEMALLLFPLLWQQQDMQYGSI